MADIATSLLKLSLTDPGRVAQPGIRHYFQHVFPATNWHDDSLRSSLNLILRRVDRFFQNIHKRPYLRVRPDLLLCLTILMPAFAFLLFLELY